MEGRKKGMSDLIIRQEAVAHLQRIREASADTPDYNEGFADGLDYCINFISALPSAEPKKGKWKHIIDLNFMCSECGWIEEWSRYCPNCGARMKNE